MEILAKPLGIVLLAFSLFLLAIYIKFDIYDSARLLITGYYFTFISGFLFLTIESWWGK